MTILVAVKKNGKVFLGSDRITTFGNEYVTDLVRGSKIIKLKHAYLATSGYSLLDNIIEHLYHSNHKLMENTFQDRAHVFSFFLELYNELRKSYTLVEPGKDTFASMYNVFLVVTPTNIFGVSTNLSVSEYPRFAARGAGSDYSVGCLYGLYDVMESGFDLTRMALESACYFNVYCKEPLDIIEVKASDFGKISKDSHKAPAAQLTTFDRLTGLKGMKLVADNGAKTAKTVAAAVPKIGRVETSGNSAKARLKKGAAARQTDAQKSKTVKSKANAKVAASKRAAPKVAKSKMISKASNRGGKPVKRSR
jgi:ATP-dependent protease HslVU (ClpYQ) peptidase subunit